MFHGGAALSPVAGRRAGAPRTSGAIRALSPRPRTPCIEGVIGMPEAETPSVEAVDALAEAETPSFQAVDALAVAEGPLAAGAIGMPGAVDALAEGAIALLETADALAFVVRQQLPGAPISLKSRRKTARAPGSQGGTPRISPLALATPAPLRLIPGLPWVSIGQHPLETARRLLPIETARGSKRCAGSGLGSLIWLGALLRRRASHRLSRRELAGCGRLVRLSQGAGRTEIERLERS